MADPFATALVTLHGSVLGQSALYLPKTGAAFPLRVIRSQGSETVGQTILDRDSLSIRLADVALPERGDEVQLLGTISVMGEPRINPVFRINGDPLLDDEGVSWDCPIVPA